MILDESTLLLNIKLFTHTAIEYKSLGMSNFPILLTENATTISLCTFFRMPGNVYLDDYFTRVLWN
jgi:hypothetical protein